MFTRLIRFKNFKRPTMVNTMNQVAALSTQTDDNQIPYSIFRKVKYKRLWTIYFRENTNDNLMEIEISVYEKFTP